MPNLSPGLNLTWQIAASEAAYTKHQFIEKEHIFIALCKVSDLLELEEIKEIENIERLKRELGQFDKLLVEFHIDRKSLRRHLRAIYGQGNYQNTEKVIHRSEECKRYFERASGLARQHRSSETNIFYILIAILEDHGEHISDALFQDWCPQI